jgi:chromosome segregation ATPase
LEKTEVELRSLLEEKTKTVEKYIIEVNEIHKKCKEKEEENITQEKCTSNLTKQLEEANKQLQEKCAFIEELGNQFKVQTENLQEEIEKLKETIHKITEHNTAEKIQLIEKCEKIRKENEESIKSQASLFKLESEKLSAKQKDVSEQLKIEKDRQIQELTESLSRFNDYDTKLHELNELKVSYKNQLEEKSKLVFI